MNKFNKWKYEEADNSLQYTGDFPVGERNLWLLENVKESDFLQSMAKTIAKALNDNKVDLKTFYKTIDGVKYLRIRRK